MSEGRGKKPCEKKHVEMMEWKGSVWVMMPGEMYRWKAVVKNVSSAGCLHGSFG